MAGRSADGHTPRGGPPGVARGAGSRFRDINTMPTYTTADIRNVLLVGHGGCGKTSLADAILFASNTVTRKGSVADGTSFSDFEKEEKEHKHSIYSSVLHLDHQGRSEEHTSELQSRQYLVCRLLLEKKNNSG